MSKSFSGKVAIVTGSSSGIGESIAIKLAAQGAAVVVCGRNVDRTQAVMDKCVAISNSDKTLMAFCGDLNDKGERDRLVTQTIAKFARLDILVANSGIMTIETIQEDTEETYDRVMDTNLKCTYFLIQQCLPHLEKTQGNIVCVSSVLSTQTLPNRVVYQMSKAALDHLVRALAVSEGPKGIRVNAVNPGVVATRLCRDTPIDEETRTKGVGSKTPLEGRVSSVEEQADVVLFLAGPGAGFVTGECVKVDGGFNLT